MLMKELDRDAGAEPEVVAKMADKEGLERRNGRFRSDTSLLLLSAALSGLRMRGIDIESAARSSCGDCGRGGVLRSSWEVI